VERTRLDDELKAELLELQSRNLLRPRPETARPQTGLVDVCSNDYLGYGRLPVSRETSTGSPGAGASRLIFGTHAAHLELERELADWVHCEAALLFSSGYVANLAALAALIKPDDVVVSDELNHASLIDGCRLSRATVVVARHRDLQAMEGALSQASARRRWVVTESYFSMDGDSPDLPKLRDLCDRRGAYLYVDEAHALGVFGPEGSGMARNVGVRPDVLVGTLGKAVGVQGAFVAGSTPLIDFLWNRARGFVFSTATSPMLTGVIRESVRRLRNDDGARARLRDLCQLFADLLCRTGAGLPEERHGPIFPILFARPERALEVAAALRREGFLAQAIRPPTVPTGTSRIRITLHADLTPLEVTRLAMLIGEQCPGS